MYYAINSCTSICITARWQASEVLIMTKNGIVQWLRDDSFSGAVKAVAKQKC